MYDGKVSHEHVQSDAREIDRTHRIMEKSRHFCGEVRTIKSGAATTEFAFVWSGEYRLTCAMRACADRDRLAYTRRHLDCRTTPT
jgi:hypothetical protein